jgi:hypothetical protein
MSTILEYIRPVHAGASSFIAAGEDIFTGSPASDVVNLENAEGIVFVIALGLNAGSGAATATVLACDDVTPNNTTAVAFTYQVLSASDVLGDVTAATSSGLAAIGTADTITLISVTAASIAAASVNSTVGNPYVQLKLTETQSDAVDGGVTAYLYGLRFAPLTATQLV